MTAIKAKIRAYFEYLPAYRENPFSLRDDDSVIECGLVDSFGIMDLIAYLFENFGVEIEADDMEKKNFESITAIEHFIIAKRDG